MRGAAAHACPEAWPEHVVMAGVRTPALCGVIFPEHGIQVDTHRVFSLAIVGG